MNIHFICRGNVLRSLIAETYLASLQLPDVRIISSGTNVDWSSPQEQEFFANTLAILNRHGINHFAKAHAEQLTQDRIDSHHDIVVMMNQRVIDEATKFVTLPATPLNWHITDIGEGDRTDQNQREQYEEEIYQEIVESVRTLLISIREN